MCLRNELTAHLNSARLFLVTYANDVALIDWITANFKWALGKILFLSSGGKAGMHVANVRDPDKVQSIAMHFDEFTIDGCTRHPEPTPKPVLRNWHCSVAKNGAAAME